MKKVDKFKEGQINKNKSIFQVLYDHRQIDLDKINIIPHTLL